MVDILDIIYFIIQFLRFVFLLSFQLSRMFLLHFWAISFPSLGCLIVGTRLLQSVTTGTVTTVNWIYSRGSLNSTKSNQKIWQKFRISDKKSGFLDSTPDFWQKVRKKSSPTGLFYMATSKCNNFFSRMNIRILFRTFCLGTYSLVNVRSRISK